jgi:hypothetical protein
VANHKLRSRRSIYISQRACKEVKQTKAHSVHAADLVRCTVAVAFASVCRPPRGTCERVAARAACMQPPSPPPPPKLPNPPHHHAANQILLASAVSKCHPSRLQIFPCDVLLGSPHVISTCIFIMCQFPSQRQLVYNVWELGS